MPSATALRRQMCDEEPPTALLFTLMVRGEGRAVQMHEFLWLVYPVSPYSRYSKKLHFIGVDHQWNVLLSIVDCHY